MSNNLWKSLLLTLILSLVFAASALAQPSQPGTLPPPAGPPPMVRPEGGDMPSMMPHMQGMRQRRQEMREHMQGQGRMQDADDDDDDDAADDDDAPPIHGMRGHHGMFLRLAQELDLTGEQRVKVRTLWHTHRKEAIRLRADIAIAAVDLHALLEADPVNLPKVKELIQAMAAKRADLHYSHITLMQDIRAVLTPEQQKKFRALMDKKFMHHHMGGHHMGGHH